MPAQTITDVARAVQHPVELVCLAAMELQHEEPDAGTVGQMHTLLREITEQAERAGVAPIVEGARLVSQAIALAEFESPAPTPYMGHFVTATAADLARVVHALLSDEDPTPILSHARETLRLMPRRSTDFLVEVDLGDQEQVAKIFAAVTEEEPELTVVQPLVRREVARSAGQSARLRELRQLLATYVTHVERLRAQPERRDTLDDLLVGAKALRASAAAADLREVNRLLGRLIAVIDAQRASPEATASDVVAFALACARAIGEAVASPNGASEMFSTLHDASSRLLQHFRVDTRQLQTGILGNGTGTADLGSRRSLYRALEGAQRPESSSPGRTPDRERLIKEIAVALTHLPGTLERLERDPRSVAAQAALAQLIQLVRGAATGAGLTTLVTRCDELEQLLDAAGSTRVPTTLLTEVRGLERDLSQLLQRADPHGGITEAPREMVNVDASALGQVVALVQELIFKSGRSGQRALQLGSSVQEVGLLGDRLRALSEHPELASTGLAGELAELAADAAILAAELGRWRDEHALIDTGTGRVLTRLSRETYALGRAPLADLVPALERAALALAGRLGKQVGFAAEVESAAINSAAVQRLNDALLHLVRNAVDYGIESPGERRARGKPETGQVRIRAYYDNRDLVLEVGDDGVGIDEAEIVRRAVDSGYPIPPEGLSRERALQLIFLPGLTTRPVGSQPAAGHGLNVVGTVVAEMKGTVQVESTLGAGTTVTLRLPQAFATTPALVVTLGETLVALPFVQAEVVPPDAVRSIEETGEDFGFVANIGGTHLPAADLGALLGYRSPWMVREPGGTLLRLRLENGERLVRVDGLIGRQELELRPLETGRHPAGVVARATVEAGGSALVVDLAQAVNGRVERALTGEPAAPVALVADDSIGARRAVCRVLEREGWRAVEARDGLEAWELLGSVIPALLLIDLDLGLLDPVQVIRAAQDQHGIPVVALASRDDPARRHELQALGVDAVLTKPVDEDGLAATLALLTPVAHRR